MGFYAALRGAYQVEHASRPHPLASLNPKPWATSVRIFCGSEFVSENLWRLPIEGSIVSQNLLNPKPLNPKTCSSPKKCRIFVRKPTPVYPLCSKSSKSTCVIGFSVHVLIPIVV